MYDNFRYSIRGIDRTIEEASDDTCVKITQIAWGVGDNEDVDPSSICLDIRRWGRSRGFSEELKPRKGVSFRNKDTPDNLIMALIEEGYGDTNKIIQSLKARINYPKDDDIIIPDKSSDAVVSKIPAPTENLKDFEISCICDARELKSFAENFSISGKVKITISKVV